MEWDILAGPVFRQIPKYVILAFRERTKEDWFLSLNAIRSTLL